MLLLDPASERGLIIREAGHHLKRCMHGKVGMTADRGAYVLTFAREQPVARLAHRFIDPAHGSASAGWHAASGMRRVVLFKAILKQVHAGQRGTTTRGSL